MRRIYGRVIVAESGMGIPNLVVEAWLWPANTTADKPLFHGAAMTEPDGRFTIGYSHDGSGESDRLRGAIGLRVFAPSRTKSAASHEGVTHDQLLLYASPVPEQEAAQSEVSVIQLSRQLLLRFEVLERTSTFDQVNPEERASRLGEYLEQTVVARRKLASQLRRSRQAEYDDAAKRRADGEAWAAQIILKRRGAATPPPAMPDRAGIEKLHRTARTDGLKRVSALISTARIPADDRTHRALGMTSSSDSISGSLSPAAAAELIFRDSASRDLIRRNHSHKAERTPEQTLAAIEAWVERQKKPENGPAGVEDDGHDGDDSNE